MRDLHWLLKVYPPAWRARYGDEFAALVAAQPLTFQLVVDVLAGAIDARLDPQIKATLAAATQPEGGKSMAWTMKMNCAGYGPNVTRRARRLAPKRLKRCLVALSRTCAKES